MLTDSRENSKKEQKQELWSNYTFKVTSRTRQSIFGGRLNSGISSDLIPWLVEATSCKTQNLESEWEK